MDDRSMEGVFAYDYGRSDDCMGVEETLDAIDLHHRSGQYHECLHTRQFQHFLLIVLFSFQEPPFEFKLKSVNIHYLLHLVLNSLQFFGSHCELIVGGNRIMIYLQRRA